MDNKKILKRNDEINRGLKLLAKSSLIVFIGLFLSKVLTYVYRIIIARYFGPEIYGLFSLALMIIGWFIAISSFGIAEGLLRYIALYRGKEEYDKIRYLLKNSLIILFFSSIISALILFSLSSFISINIFHNQNLIIFLKIFSIVIPIFIFANVFNSVIRAFEKISWYSFISNILQNVFKVVILILLIFLGFNSNSIIFSYFLAILSMLIISFLFCKYKLPEIFGKYKLKKEIKTKISREFLSYSWPIIFLNITSLIFYWIDSFTIGYFMEAISVGLYNAAVPIASLLGFVQELFMQLFFPLITKHFSKKNFLVIKELSRQVAKWIFLLTLPLFLIIFIFPESIINLLFGQDYLTAATALRMLSLGGLIYSSTVLASNLVLMIGKSKLILINIGIMSIVNIILNIILVPKYGINGAAFATMLVMLILSLILFLETKYFAHINLIQRELLRISAISIILIPLFFYFKTLILINTYSFLVLGTFLFLSYIFLILITNCLSKNDFMILKAIKNKIKKIGLKLTLTDFYRDFY